MPNSSCNFRKHKSVFFQIFHQYSVLSNVTRLYFFSSNIIYFGQKETIKVHIFEIFECSGQNSSNSLPILNWQVNSSSRFASVFIAMTYNFRLNFIKLIHFKLREEDAIKVPSLRLSSALIKICQIPHVILGSTTKFPFKLCKNLECYQT